MNEPHYYDYTCIECGEMQSSEVKPHGLLDAATCPRCHEAGGPAVSSAYSGGLHGQGNHSGRISITFHDPHGSTTGREVERALTEWFGHRATVTVTFIK